MTVLRVATGQKLSKRSVCRGEQHRQDRMEGRESDHPLQQHEIERRQRPTPPAGQVIDVGRAQVRILVPGPKLGNSANNTLASSRATIAAVNSSARRR